MKIERTAAKIGRSMKKRESMRAPYFSRRAGLPALGGFPAALPGGRAVLGRRSRAARTCTGAPGPIFMTPSTMTRSPGLQPGLDDPAVARPFADLHRARLDLALRVHDVDELVLRAFEHRALRHDDRRRAHRAFEHDAHELAGAQHVLAVGELGARFARAGLRVHAHVGEVERRRCACSVVPSASLTVVLKRLPAGSLSRPASTSRRIARYSRSGMPKITYIGSICVTVVSSTLGPETSVPSETAARLRDAADRRLDARVARDSASLR